MFLPAHLLEIIHARMHARSCARVSAFHCQRTLCAGWLNVFMFTPSAAAIHFIHPMGNDAPMCFSGLINQCDTLTAFGGVHAAGVVLFASATDEALKAAFATASNLYLFTPLRIQQARPRTGGGPTYCARGPSQHAAFLPAPTAYTRRQLLSTFLTSVTLPSRDMMFARLSRAVAPSSPARLRIIWYRIWWDGIFIFVFVFIVLFIICWETWGAMCVSLIPLSSSLILLATLPRAYVRSIMTDCFFPVEIQDLEFVDYPVMCKNTTLVNSEIQRACVTGLCVCQISPSCHPHTRATSQHRYPGLAMRSCHSCVDLQCHSSRSAIFILGNSSLTPRSAFVAHVFVIAHFNLFFNFIGFDFNYLRYCYVIFNWQATCYG